MDTYTYLYISVIRRKLPYWTIELVTNYVRSFGKLRVPVEQVGVVVKFVFRGTQSLDTNARIVP
jgi:hypothetical protein